MALVAGLIVGVLRARTRAGRLPTRRKRGTALLQNWHVGMKAEQVRRQLGQPTTSKIEGVTKSGTRERWVYETRNGELLLWFKDGVLTEIEE